MCLYPRLIYNKRYTANKKNGGIIPPVPDNRVLWTPIGCGVCIECKTQKCNGWRIRLMEELDSNSQCKFVTLTFSTESLQKLKTHEKCRKLEGYQLDNQIATVATRLFLERYRKEHKKSLRHWLITELGDGHSEHMHMHGIVWSTDLDNIDKHWQYGHVWKGYKNDWGQYQNYVNEKTINYIVKYVIKQDTEHLNYTPIILASPGIGRDYKNKNHNNKYKGKETQEYYRTKQGYKIGLPTYYRNHIYTEKEKEQLWINKLDKGTRYVCGEKVIGDYNNLVEYHRKRTLSLGYRSPSFIWKRKIYEHMHRCMMHRERGL